MCTNGLLSITDAVFAPYTFIGSGKTIRLRGERILEQIAGFLEIIATHRHGRLGPAIPISPLAS